MPYTVVHHEDTGKYCVHKKNKDGSAGEMLEHACHATPEKAGAQIGAIEHAEKQIAESPSVSFLLVNKQDALENIARAYMYNDRLDKAAEVADKLPDDRKASMLIDLGSRYHWKEDDEQARTLWTKAQAVISGLDKEDKSWKTYLLASAMAACGFIDEALALAEGMDEKMKEELLKAVTKKEGNERHPASHYLVVEDPAEPSKWHLRVKGPDGKPDHRLMGAAWAALHGGYRGNKYEGPEKASAIAKLKRMYKSEGLETPKSLIAFKQDKSGQTWFIGLYSNKFSDRQDQILSEAAHKDFIEWLEKSTIHPPVTLFHQPRPLPGFWVRVFDAFEEKKLSADVVNRVLRDFYRDHAIGETEKVFLANGFVGVAAKVYGDRLEQAKRLANYPEELGMSHGFVPVELNGNIFEKYRSFEFSILPKSRAANTWTQAMIMEAKEMPVDKDVKEFLDKIETGLGEEVDQATDDEAKKLQDAGVEYKETAAPTAEELVAEMVKQMKFEEFTKVIADTFNGLKQQIATLEARVKAVEASDDEKIARQYEPGWQKLLKGPSESETTVTKENGNEAKKQQPFDFLTALGVK